MVTPSVTRAVFVACTHTTPKAAATPTLLLDWPALAPEAELPEPAALFALGTALAPLPPAFGSLATVSWAVASALLPPSSDGFVPTELALAWASTVMRASEVTEASTTVALRASSARLDQPTTSGRATAAPTPTSDALTSPFAWVSVRSESWVAAIVRLPVMTSAAPVPTRAVAFSPTLTTRATAGLMAVPPLAPASATVEIHRCELAVTVTSWPPVTDTPSATSALVRVEASTWIAAEAPTPVPLPSLFSPVIFLEMRHGRPRTWAQALKVGFAEAPATSASA